MKGLHVVTFSLIVLGALNWGLVGLFDYNLVNSLLGATGAGGLEQLIYILVGVSAVVEIAGHNKNCKLCGK